jgi:prepilin-type processing-associated H-X9-DG protein
MGALRRKNWRHPRRAFSLAELMVVVGVIALLIALMLPPLQMAREQARRTQCSAHLRSLGHALQNLNNEYGYYPLWDDGGAPIRYTWIDVVIQQRALGSSATAAPLKESNGGSWAREIHDQTRVGYCPSDRLPDSLNAARHTGLIHPRSGQRGLDYSYGIGAALSAGGWVVRDNTEVVNDRPRRFVDHMRNTSGRVLAGDAVESVIYNLSGNAFESQVWNDPTQWDNTVAWNRHRAADNRGGANFLFQDGHVAARFYKPRAALPINTSLTYVWQPGEPIEANPSTVIDSYAYPSVPPLAVGDGGVFPNELVPTWYTANRRWTMIGHK